MRRGRAAPEIWTVARVAEAGVWEPGRAFHDDTAITGNLSVQIHTSNEMRGGLCRYFVPWSSTGAPAPMKCPPVAMSDRGTGGATGDGAGPGVGVGVAAGLGED